MSSRVRSTLVLLVGGSALVFAADVVVRTPGFLVPRDFLEYWAAGRVNLRGGNPYHPDELLAEQKHADPTREHAVMMWNPPPAIGLYMPLGALPARWATLLWVGLQLAAVFIACDLLWRSYSQCGRHTPCAVSLRPLAERADHTQSHSYRWLASIVALSFAGTWWLVAYGQNTGLMLLGLAGFLHFTQKDKPLAAGACAALTALKPHLLAVFGVLLVADILTRRERSALASGITFIVAALCIALVANPLAITQFIEAAQHPAEGATPLSEWWLPVPSFWLRMEIAPGQFWIQFIPCVLACVGFLAYRFWKENDWHWPRALPLVVVVSVLTTPYGGWVFDLPVLLVAVIWAAARLASAKQWALLTLFVVAQFAITAASFAWPGALHDYWWVAPASLAPCLLVLWGRGATDQRG
ncbi:MAG: DUF2029 domain-containing protein [Planctomycetia bacterium]|nr:DUF2029 domain-containing protein [Planctomycetia bacterium]